MIAKILRCLEGFDFGCLVGLGEGLTLWGKVVRIVSLIMRRMKFPNRMSCWDVGGKGSGSVRDAEAML